MNSQQQEALANQVAQKVVEMQQQGTMTELAQAPLPDCKEINSAFPK